MLVWLNQALTLGRRVFIIDPQLLICAFGRWLLGLLDC